MKVKSISDDLSRIINLSKEKTMKKERRTKIYISEQISHKIYLYVYYKLFDANFSILLNDS